MELQLSVVAETTPDQKQVRLVLTGRLTTTNQHMLYPLIHRAHASEAEVIIDLTAVDHLETAALDLLRWDIEHHETTHPVRAVRFVPPATGSAPAHGD